MIQTQHAFTKTGSTKWSAAGISAGFDAMTRRPITLMTVYSKDDGAHVTHKTQMDALEARALAAQLVRAANETDKATGTDTTNKPTDVGSLIATGALATVKPVKITPPAAFNPYTAIGRYNGLASTSGINWSYAEFTSKADCEAFDKACNDNGYRTRNLHETTQSVGPNTWSVQYHHYSE